MLPKIVVCKNSNAFQSYGRFSEVIIIIYYYLSSVNCMAPWSLSWSLHNILAGYGYASWRVEEICVQDLYACKVAGTEDIVRV